MKLYLIRHAESSNNVLWARDGTDHGSGRVADPEITEIGHKQAAMLGTHIISEGTEPRQAPPVSRSPDSESTYQFTHLYCSLMTRSLLTANYLRESSQLTLEALPDIFERMGLYDVDENGKEVGVEGPGRDYFESRFPSVQLPDSLDNVGWWNRPIETDDDFLQRVKVSLESVIGKHQQSDDRVAMVVHGDYIDQSINYLMDVPRTEVNYKSPWVANWVFHNTSVSRIDVHGAARNVVYLNRIDHLTPKHVTW